LPDNSLPHFTPCFDWVLRATGDSSCALAYGIIWRYAQMRSARCYASCERLSSELGWTRQRIMRHLHTLLSLRLITCVNPTDKGVPREYIPLTQEQWLPLSTPPPSSTPVGATPRGRPPVISQATPCNMTPHPPVTPCDTSKTSNQTIKKPDRFRASPPSPKPQIKHSRADARTRTPAIQAVRHITGSLPSKALYDKVISTIGPNPSLDRLRQCYETWCARGYNPRNLAWLFEWYAAQGHPPPVRHKDPPSPYAPQATADEFARWREYQERVQKGEDPDETRRRLGL